MITLEDLLKEWKRRQEAKRAAEKPGQATIQEETKPKDAKSTWKEKREAWNRYYRDNPNAEPSAGEICNMLDGLDPEGYDQGGARRSFIETGKSLNRQPSCRISE